VPGWPMLSGSHACNRESSGRLKPEVRACRLWDVSGRCGVWDVTFSSMITQVLPCADAEWEAKC
jgi:hypothetical protein